MDAATAPTARGTSRSCARLTSACLTSSAKSLAATKATARAQLHPRWPSSARRQALTEVRTNKRSRCHHHETRPVAPASPASPPPQPFAAAGRKRRRVATGGGGSGGGGGRVRGRLHRGMLQPPPPQTPPISDPIMYGQPHTPRATCHGARTPLNSKCVRSSPIASCGRATSPRPTPRPKRAACYTHQLASHHSIPTPTRGGLPHACRRRRTCWRGRV